MRNPSILHPASSNPVSTLIVTLIFPTAPPRQPTHPLLTSFVHEALCITSIQNLSIERLYTTLHPRPLEKSCPHKHHHIEIYTIPPTKTSIKIVTIPSDQNLHQKLHDDFPTSPIRNQTQIPQRKIPRNLRANKHRS
jgi:hypothetical protein